MNFLNLVLAFGLIAAAVILAIISEGVFLPASIPIGAYGVKLLGVKM